MSDKPIYNEPSQVKVDKGVIAVEGPDEVDVALTPEAAEETSDRLFHGAMAARGKRRLAKLPHRPK
jgi:hypothetical protein